MCECSGQFVYNAIDAPRICVCASELELWSVIVMNFVVVVVRVAFLIAIR